MPRRRLFGGLLLAALSVSNAVADDALRIDPLLLAEAATVWDVAAKPDNPLWPGWNAADTPLLIYLPGVQDVLLNHPQPPAGFLRYAGPLSFPGGAIFLRNGPTLIDWDGQNTSRDVYGVETLVLADTLSNRKMSLRGWLEDPRPAETKLAELGPEQLAADPYEQMAMIAHEAFHVFQAHSAPNKGADERNVRLYPCLAVKNNVGFALEGRALADALRAADPTAARAAAVRWLAVRRDRRAALPPQAVAYEDANEFNEGLAKYIEWRLFKVLEGRRPPDALHWAQGFRGFDNLAAPREQRLESLLRHMRGEINVNNDPYGASPLRMRLYFSGMAIAALLDRFAPDWKTKIFADGATLTQLAADALQASPQELQAALAAAQNDPETARLFEAKTQLETAGRRDTEKMLAAITAGPHPSLLLDYAPLNTSKVALSFTPFGVRAADAERTIYTLVPIEAQLGSSAYGFKQAAPTPTLEDRGQRQFQFQLAAPLGAAELAALLKQPAGRSWTVENLDVELPGAHLKAKRAQIEHQGQTIRVRYLPAE